jgi:hypothetical protein
MIYILWSAFARASPAAQGSPELEHGAHGIISHATVRTATANRAADLASGAIPETCAALGRALERQESAGIAEMTVPARWPSLQGINSAEFSSLGAAGAVVSSTPS